MGSNVIDLMDALRKSVSRRDAAAKAPARRKRAACRMPAVAKPNAYAKRKAG
jgi:non-homologous end joining protein Ku